MVQENGGLEMNGDIKIVVDNDQVKKVKIVPPKTVWQRFTKFLTQFVSASFFFIMGLLIGMLI